MAIYDILTTHKDQRDGGDICSFNGYLEDYLGTVSYTHLDVYKRQPMDDPEIPYHYNKVNVEKQKKENKMALQKELGLQVDPNVMLIGVVSRLTWQKGFYLLMEKLNELCAAPIQLAVLGSGDVYKRQHRLEGCR